MRRFLIAAALLAPACAVPGDAAWSDLHANGFVGLYNTAARGDASLSGTSGGLTANGDLDIRESSESNLYYGVRAGFAPVELIFSGFSHDSTHGGEFVGTLDGINFTAAADARTVLDFDLQRIAIGFDVLNLPVARLGLILGVDFFTFNEFSFTASSGAIERSYTIADNEDAPVPVVGIRADALVPATGLRFGGEMTGFKADVEDVEAEFFDLDLQVGYAPLDNDWLELVLGYRMIDFDFDGELDDNNIDGNLEFDGFYWGVGITW